MDDSRLNILIADFHLQGGGQVRYALSLARELVRFGHRVTVACRQGSVLVDAARAAGCEVIDRFNFRGGLRPLSWAADLRRARSFIRAEKPDILHVNGSQDHWSLALANRGLGFPVCLVRTRHNTYTVKDHLPNRLLNREWTDYQIVVCDVVRRTLSGQRAFDPVRLCSIHNGVDADLYHPDAARRAAARAEFGYTDDDLVCGIAARMVAAKGHQFLFRAVAQLVKLYPALKILCLGQGALQEDLKKLAGDLRIAERVSFAGFREDMEYCLQAADIGVQPSIDCDTSSFSLKEMMALEIPVVASDYGGLKEIVSDGVEGFVVRAGTVEPLAAALRRMAQSAELRARMGRMGRQRVLADFTLEVFARRTEHAYRRAIEIHRQRRPLVR
jgi:glycosyltransferase involved in cell wall biosynthesis